MLRSEGGPGGGAGRDGVWAGAGPRLPRDRSEAGQPRGQRHGLAHQPGQGPRQGEVTCSDGNISQELSRWVW